MNEWSCKFSTICSLQMFQKKSLVENINARGRPQVEGSHVNAYEWLAPKTDQQLAPCMAAKCRMNLCEWVNECKKRFEWK